MHCAKQSKSVVKIGTPSLPGCCKQIQARDFAAESSLHHRPRFKKLNLFRKLDQEVLSNWLISFANPADLTLRSSGIGEISFHSLSFPHLLLLMLLEACEGWNLHFNTEWFPQLKCTLVTIHGPSRQNIKKNERHSQSYKSLEKELQMPTEILACLLEI